MANATQCWDAGLMLNNPSIPACRSRSMDKSSLYPEAAPAYYSYQTCGSLNNYDVSRHLTNMKGSEIITTTTQDAPYTTRDEKVGVLPSFRGALVCYRFLLRFRGALPSFRGELLTWFFFYRFQEGSDGFPVVTFGGVQVYPVPLISSCIPPSLLPLASCRSPLATCLLPPPTFQVDFMRSVLTRFQPAMGMEIVDGWATAGSRAKFSSSYTAAVHDVAVGNFDIAIGDFWVT